MRKDERVELAMRLVDRDTFRQWSRFSSYEQREGWKAFKRSIRARYEETWEYYEGGWKGESHYSPDDEYVESCYEDGTLRPYLKAFWKELAWRREDVEDSYDYDDYVSDPCIIASSTPSTPSEPPIVGYPSLPTNSQVDPHTDQQLGEEDTSPHKSGLDGQGIDTVHYDAEVDEADEKCTVLEEEQPERDTTEEILQVEADHYLDQEGMPTVPEDYAAATAASVLYDVESSADADEPPKAVHAETDAAQIPAVTVIAPESTPMTATSSAYAMEKQRTLVPQIALSPSRSSRLYTPDAPANPYEPIVGRLLVINTRCRCAQRRKRGAKSCRNLTRGCGCG
ncbi:hypothetical protein BDZ89DRAFT_1078356 [Hymenopellis radicata]|nr:hypothetical protein BDZ89DRAFT_1078356 [Hymenopellis radicata]